ncbi:MAG TPA: hypothetical protein VE422_44630 [Terriglobia bacterium]|nr:hypothetical protein [Terriglobia bacterium]
MTAVKSGKLKIEFDMVLLIVASGLYRILAQRMRGYSDAQAPNLPRSERYASRCHATEREVE